MPRVTGRRHRSNAAADSVFDYFKKLMLPFHFLTCYLKEQFSSLALATSSLLGIIPTVICTKETDISDAIKMHSQDVLSPELGSQKLEVTICTHASR